MSTVESQLCFALYSTVHALGRVYAPVLAELGLTYPQYLVMLVLWETDNLTVKGLGARLFLDSGTLTPLLKRLESAGLLDRTRDLADERQVRVRLTEMGRAMRGKSGAVTDHIGCAMGRSPQELATLRDDLLELRSTLMRERPPVTTTPAVV